MKSPAFQFYPADYLADAKVQALSIEGEGCYFRLLCYCWREGFISADRVAIARLCKGYDGPGIDEALSMFSRGEKRGQLIHRRLDKERKRQEERSKYLRERGLEGALKRWHKDGVAIIRPMANDSSSSSSSASALNPLTPFEKGGQKKPNNRKTRRMAVGSSGNVAEGVARATERNRQRFPELAEKDDK